jgi:hypothetical protein
LSGAGGQLNRVLVKTNTAFLVQVEGSAIICNLDVAGANSNWALDMSGARIKLGLVLGLDNLGVHSNLVQAQF